MSDDFSDKDPANDDLRSAASASIEFSHIPLRHACSKCGEAYGYTKFGDFHRVAYCEVCDEPQTGWTFSNNEVFGASENRETRFAISPKSRLTILKRDRFRCVHCRNEALSLAEAQQRLIDILAVNLGNQWQELVENRSDEHCASCHQYLPGVILQIPFPLLKQLPDEAVVQIKRTLRQRFLDIDHLIPVSIQKRLRKPIERSIDSFLRTRLLAASCGDCNFERSSLLHSEESLREILTEHISETPERLRVDAELLRRAYFEAVIAERALNATG